MSYVFSGKIQSAMFVNPPQNSTIELLYGEGTELTAFHLDVNYSSDEFLAFVDEWPLEKVEQTARDTARNINAERRFKFCELMQYLLTLIHLHF